jgi:hypothetical protein
VCGEGGGRGGRGRFDPYELSRRLWGDIWYHPETRTFRRKGGGAGAERSFVAFILEPLYKLCAAAVAEHPKVLEGVLAELGASLRPAAYSQDVKPLLKDACRAVFGAAGGLADMLARHVPSARRATAGKVGSVCVVLCVLRLLLCMGGVKDATSPPPYTTTAKPNTKTNTKTQNHKGPPPLHGPARPRGLALGQVHARRDAARPARHARRQAVPQAGRARVRRARARRQRHAAAGRPGARLGGGARGVGQ